MTGLLRALESVIYVQSYKTAIILGAARGAAILAAAENGLPIFEYPPRRIKQSTVGRGAAGKDQVAFMVRALLGLNRDACRRRRGRAGPSAFTHLRMQEAAALGIGGAVQNITRRKLNAVLRKNGNRSGRGSAEFTATVSE